MAITATALTVSSTDPSGKTLFAINFYSADASGAETIKAAPSSGAIYITDLAIVIHGDITADLGSGEDSSAVETAAFKFVGTTEGTPIVMHLREPIKLVDAKTMTLDASGAGPISGVVEGFVS